MASSPSKARAAFLFLVRQHIQTKMNDPIGAYLLSLLDQQPDDTPIPMKVFANACVSAAEKGTPRETQTAAPEPERATHPPSAVLQATYPEAMEYLRHCQANKEPVNMLYLCENTGLSRADASRLIQAAMTMPKDGRAEVTQRKPRSYVPNAAQKAANSNCLKRPRTPEQSKAHSDAIKAGLLRAKLDREREAQGCV